LILNVAIVEDDAESVKLLKSYFIRYQRENQNIAFEFYIFDDGVKIISNFKPIYDIILLDIEMEITDGLRTAEIIRETDQKVIIIFVTNMPQYAIKGYSVNATNYLLKPLPYFAFSEEISKSIERIKREKQNKNIIIKTENCIKKIDSDEILFIESIKHDLIIHTEQDFFEIRDTLKKYEDILQDYNFNRANNSYLINLKHVKGVEQDFALVGNHKLKIARSKKKQFMEHLVNYLGEKV
jgi:DNA-binding LytR/AlgR family response regulator